MPSTSVRPRPVRRPAEERPEEVPPIWQVRVGALMTALVLALVPIGLWAATDDRHLLLGLWVVSPAALFLGVCGYLGARSILRTPR